MKKLLTVFASLLVLIPLLAGTVYGSLFKDSEGWKNVTDKEATALLKSTRNDKDESFILVLYGDSCAYSASRIPEFEKYAKTNGIVLSGISNSDYPSWTEWTRYSNHFVISYPFIFVYNHEKDSLSSENGVRSLDAFKKLLSKMEYPLNPQTDDNDGKSEEKTEEKAEEKPLFSDVDTNHKNYEAIKYLVKAGIVTGYEDDTFKPDNPINRSEAATIIVRAAKLKVDSDAASIYSDVADSFWGRPYIMAATKEGIINGMGDNLFAPTSNITHNQIIKMVVCMKGLDKNIDKATGWPVGYLDAAVNNDIIDNAAYIDLFYNIGSSNATRGDVAQYVYNALMLSDADTVLVGTNIYCLGMSVDELDEPDDTLSSTGGHTWYVYGTKDYTDFVALGVADGKVKVIVSAGSGFTYMGYKAGDILNKSVKGLKLDENDDNKVHAVIIGNTTIYTKNITKNTLSGESVLNFHLVNAFRVLHGRSILKWSDNAANAALLHSEDMADQFYFTHDSLDGRSFSKRLTEQGVRWASCGENIACGIATGLDAYCNWVNSSGHRNNMLNAAYTYLGVGAGYNKDNKYSAYFTQDFYR